ADARLSQDEGEGGGMMILALILAAATPAQQTMEPVPPANAPADRAREAAADKAVAALVPKGIYMTMMRDKMPQLVDAMIAQMMTATPGQLGLSHTPESDGDESLGALAVADDPY